MGGKTVAVISDKQSSDSPRKIIRRRFLGIAAAAFIGSLAAACGEASGKIIPTSTAPLPAATQTAPAPVPTATPTPQPTVTPTASLTPTEPPTATETPKTIGPYTSFADFELAVKNDTKINEHWPTVDGSSKDAFIADLRAKEAILREWYLAMGATSHNASWKIDADVQGPGTVKILDSVGTDYKTSSMFSKIGFLITGLEKTGWPEDQNDPENQMLIVPSWITPSNGKPEDGHILWTILDRSAQIGGPLSPEMNEYNTMFQKNGAWADPFVGFVGNPNEGDIIRFQAIYERFIKRGFTDGALVEQAFEGLVAGTPISDNLLLVTMGCLTTGGLD